MKWLRKKRRTLRRVGVRLRHRNAAIEELRDAIHGYGLGAHNASENAKVHERKARRLRRRGHARRAAWQEAAARRAHGRAHNRQDKAQALLPALKRQERAAAQLEDVRDQLKHDIAEYVRTHGPSLQGNTAHGGSAVQRVRLVALTAAAWDADGRRDSFYDQEGYFTAQFAVTGEPRSARSDCSQFSISVSHSAGLADPGGGGFNDGFTGSIVANCEQISEAEMKQIGCGFVVYGYGNGYHMEVFVGPGDDTVGHGDDEVNKGSVHMLPVARFYRIPGT